MFDVGWTELVVVACVAILVVGPKDLPAMLRAFGKTVGGLRRMAGDFQRQFNEALKEAELDDVQKTAAFKPLEDAREAANTFQNSIKESLGTDLLADDSPAPETTNGSGQPADGAEAAAAKPAAKRSAKATKAKAGTKAGAGAAKKPVAKAASTKTAAAKKVPAKTAAARNDAASKGSGAARAASKPASKPTGKTASKPAGKSAGRAASKSTGKATGARAGKADASTGA